MATTVDSDSSIIKNVQHITIDSDISDGILDVDDDHPSVLTSEDDGLQWDHNCYSNVQPISVLPTPTSSKSDTTRISSRRSYLRVKASKNRKYMRGRAAKKNRMLQELLDYISTDVKYKDMISAYRENRGKIISLFHFLHCRVK